MYMMIFRVMLMPALVMLSFFTGWRMATRLIVDECQRFGGFVSGKKEFRCISTMQMWLMHESPNQRIYIAGPMTGLPDNNYPAFHEAAARLRKRCWHVENPAENPAPPRGRRLQLDCVHAHGREPAHDLPCHLPAARLGAIQGCLPGAPGGPALGPGHL